MTEIGSPAGDRQAEPQAACVPRRISVVIPCHNYGRFVTEAVESLMAQTRRPDEVVIVDDGSTDDTAQAIAALQARFTLTLIARHPARGAVSTFNDGIRASTGDLVMLLSADDRLSPRYLECSEQAILDGADIAATPAKLFGNVDGWWPVPPLNLTALLVSNLYHGSALYRRSLFDMLGGYRDVMYEDWEFWIGAVVQGAIVRPVDGCWLEYRQHGPSRRQMGRWRGHRERLRIWGIHRRAVGWRHLVAAAWLIVARAIAKLGTKCVRR
jgi:O-antigen biosynthesis protein